MRDLVFLHGGASPECRAFVDKHFIGYHTLQYVDRGRVEVFYRRERHLLEPGWFWPAYPGPPIRFHAADANGCWSHRYIAFAGGLVNQWQAEGILPREPRRGGGDIQKWAAAMDTVIAEAFAGGLYHQRRAANLLENLLCSLAEPPMEGTGPATPWFAAVVRGMEAENDWPDYQRLATKLGFSLGSLRRKFQAAIGIPLHKYAIQRRMQRACAMLGETNMTVDAIAASLGYRDIYFFSRQFSSHMKLPPSAYRQSLLKTSRCQSKEQTP